MQCFAFVELPEETASILGVGVPPEDMQGSGEAAVLLESARQRILLRMGLELLNEERGRHPPEPDRSSHP